MTKPSKEKAVCDGGMADMLQAEYERLSDLKAQWLDKLAKHYFPDHIYELGRHRKRLRYVAKWMEDQGYRLLETHDEHGNLLSKFCRLQDGKVTELAEFLIELRGKQE